MAPLECPRKDCKWTTGANPESVWSELLRVHGDEHRESFQSTTNNQPNKAEKMKQPSISTGCTAEEWAFFLTEWADYKQLTKPSEEDTSRILLQCCDTELRRNLHRYHGNLGTKKEDVVLTAIKQHAVQVENIVNSRVDLLHMKQDRDEPVRSFVARLKGQANICNYVLQLTCPCKCGHQFEAYYTDHQVRDVLASGLADTDIRSDVLSDINQETSLDKLVLLIETKEVGKKSASRFSETHKTSAVRSTYRRERNPAPNTHGKHKYTSHKNQYCSWCGNQGHGNFRDFEIRRKVCPAFNHTCKFCSKKGHYEKVCRERQAIHPHQPSTSAVNTEPHEASCEGEDQAGAIQQWE